MSQTYKSFNLKINMDYLETYDFFATSKEYAKEQMEGVIKEHYLKYGKKLHIQDLWMINHNLRRCNLVY